MMAKYLSTNALLAILVAACHGGIVPLDDSAAAPADGSAADAGPPQQDANPGPLDATSWIDATFPLDAVQEGAAPPPCFANVPFTPPAWKPPTPLHQAACTAGEIQQVAACVGVANCSTGNSTCDHCALTDVGAAAYGPVVTQSLGSQVTYVETNWGGCQANLDGQTANGSCGNQTDDWQSCLWAECGTCNPIASCIGFAGAGPCATHSETTACSGEWATDGGISMCANLQSLLTVWCGP